MFDAEELSKLDSDYFNIIVADDRDVTIQSKNTGHYWYMHCTGYPTEAACVIFHKHKHSHPYHRHGRARTLRLAVKSIKRHDNYQMHMKNDTGKQRAIKNVALTVEKSKCIYCRR